MAGIHSDNMDIKDKILSDLKAIHDPVILNLVFEFIRVVMPGTKEKAQGNKDAVLVFAGCLSSEDTLDINNIINQEFNTIEGDW